jgi:hypothetical protein
MLKVVTKGFTQLERNLKAESVRQEKALNTAVKVEGFRLMRLLKKQIRDGAPGGQKFNPLTFLARRWGSKGNRLRPNKPLRRLAIAIRYFIKDFRPLDMRIGWVGPRTSKSWKRIAKLQQEGFTRPVAEKRRKSFAALAAAMSEKSPARPYMFLKKSTKMLTTPARPILDPFWRTEKQRAWRNIQRNYRLKMKGQRI